MPLSPHDPHADDRPGLPARVVAGVRRDLPLVLLDLLAVLAAYLAPLVLRFDGAVPDRFWASFWSFVPAAALLHLLANYLFGLYGQMWRYASVQEARRLVLSGVTGSSLVVSTVLLLDGSTHVVPLSVAILGGAASLAGFGLLRFQSRLFGFRRRLAEEEPARVLVVGAGDAGAQIVDDLIEHPELGRHPVGIVDDSPRKLGVSLHGVPVLGGRPTIPRLCATLDVGEVLLAIPSATGTLVDEVASLCERAEVPLRVLPSVREVVGGRVSVSDIRDLSIEDLLGRRQVETDLGSMASMLRERRVLITGAGGSIGAEIARQVSSFGPAALALLDHDETHLHDLAQDVGPRVRLVLADVRDRDRMLAVFERQAPEVVFHAAAHKHVHFLESYPEEALATNVLGTANVADAAVAVGARRFVLISTDKAVEPSSVMGASKWFAERIVRSLAGAGCVFSSVRFGNVLGSRGSVIPTFLRQIRAGGPVTVTDPAMTRYFMSVEEAVQLVLQAAALSEGGEVFTLDMGEPVNILDLARRLIRLAGRVPGVDIPIEIVGARPGEKLAERLASPDERLEPTAHPSISATLPPLPEPAALRAAIREMERLAAEGRTPELSDRIVEMAGGLSPAVGAAS